MKKVKKPRMWRKVVRLKKMPQVHRRGFRERLLVQLEMVEELAVEMCGGHNPDNYEENVSEVKSIARRLRKLIQLSSVESLKTSLLVE